MTDDIVFCAKTGREIVQSSSGSNVIPFPRRSSDRPKPDPLSYAERVTFEDIDKAVQSEVAAIDQSSDDLEISNVVARPARMAERGSAAVVNG